MFRRRHRDTGGGPESGAGLHESADSAAADDEDAAAEYAAQEYAAEDEYGPEDDQDVDYDADADYPEPEYADADEAEYAAADFALEDGEPGFAADDDNEAAGRPGRGRAERADLGDPATWTRLRDTQSAEPAAARTAGPWDSTSEFPDVPRIDFGSLLVPVREGYDVQVLMSEEEGIAIAVVSGDGGLQLQPFAAPRSSGLWHEVLPEIAAEVAKAGGQSEEQVGPFGPELIATVVPQESDDGVVAPQPLRFIGVDGPRWFLRGLISGPAAADTQLAEPFRDIFADVVVVRGEHAEPPRKPLEIQLPDEARQVLENEATQQEADPFDPFERGPEITETR